MRRRGGEAVVDTNLLIYYFFEDQERRGEAIRVLEGLEIWVVPAVVLMELAWFCRGIGLGWRETRDLMVSVLMREEVKVEPLTEEDFLEALSTCGDPLEFEDELILAVAERLGLPVATLDSELRERASSRGVPVLP